MWGCQGGQILHLPLGASSCRVWCPVLQALALSSGLTWLQEPLLTRGHVSHRQLGLSSRNAAQQTNLSPKTNTALVNTTLAEQYLPPRTHRHTATPAFTNLQYISRVEWHQLQINSKQVGWVTGGLLVGTAAFPSAGLCRSWSELGLGVQSQGSWWATAPNGPPHPSRGWKSPCFAIRQSCSVTRSQPAGTTLPDPRLLHPLLLLSAGLTPCQRLLWIHSFLGHTHVQRQKAEGRLQPRPVTSRTDPSCHSPAECALAGGAAGDWHGTHRWHGRFSYWAGPQEALVLPGVEGWFFMGWFVLRFFSP